MITAVTTCMGRREHLEVTLPLMLEEFDSVIVVDWSCPQDTGYWAAKQGAQVLFKFGEEHFYAARARNFGAGQVKTRKICFLDADTMVQPGLKKELDGLIESQSMVLAAQRADGTDLLDLCGFIALDLSHFWAVKGYDESIIGYGGEDTHLRCKLFCERSLDVRRTSLLMALRHGNEVRGRHHPEPLHTSATRNHEHVNEYMKTQGIPDWLTDPRTAEIAFRIAP